MNALHEQKIDFDVALEWEEASFERHEFILGRLRRRQGRPTRECDVIMNLITAFGTRVQHTKYRCLSSEMRLRIGDELEWFYPTLFLYEPPLRFHASDEKGFVNPRLIVEVFSRETEELDGTVRFDRYKRIPELSDYILVSADEVRVEHFRRMENGDWSRRVYVGRDAELQLDNFEIAVPLSEIYRKVSVETQPVLPFGEES